jgi:hypothetical protein
MPACYICSRSAKHANLEVNKTTAHLCSNKCLMILMEMLKTTDSPRKPFPLSKTIEDMHSMYPHKNLLVFEKQKAISFCFDTMQCFQRNCLNEPQHIFSPVYDEQLYLQTSCLEEVGKLTEINFETAIPVIIRTFIDECENQIPF